MSAAAVITIDGPAASGKGTIAQRVAAALSFHYFDSGKIYRAVAFAAQQRQIDTADTNKLAALVQTLAADNQYFSRLMQDAALLSPPIGQAASALAGDSRLRRMLTPLQTAMRRPPGLVTDGRDMGTVIFPDAAVKVFLTADVQIRAQRRLLQLQNRGICATISGVCADIKQRDLRDFNRAVAPLKPAAGALQLNSSNQSIGDIAETILRAYRNIAVHSSAAESLRE